MKLKEYWIIEAMLSSKDLLYTLYEIGMHIVSGFWSLDEAYKTLYQLHGNTIIFSKRSIKIAKRFYIKYCNLDYSMWDFTSYIVLYQLLVQKNSIDEDIFILTELKKNYLNYKESLHYLRYRRIKHFNDEEDVLLTEFKNLIIK